MFETQLRLLSRAGLALGVLAIGAAPRALSGQQVANLDVSMTLVTPAPTCSTTIDAADVGQLDAGSTPSITSQPFNLNLDCTGAIAAVTATFDSGLNPFTAGNIRRMTEAGGAAHPYLIIETGVGSVAIGGTINFAAPAGVSTKSMFVTVQGGLQLPTTTGVYTDQVGVTFTF